jgi:hypothetical protein
MGDDRAEIRSHDVREGFEALKRHGIGFGRVTSVLQKEDLPGPHRIWRCAHCRSVDKTRLMMIIVKRATHRSIRFGTP